jgi:hypothetical protein
MQVQPLEMRKSRHMEVKGHITGKILLRLIPGNLHHSPQSYHMPQSGLSEA